jgi:ATP-dependent RNA helicase DeaD
VAGRELFQIHNIERFTKMKIQRGKPPTVDEVEDARANVFLDKVRATLQNSEFKREDHLIERLLEEGFSSTDIASALLHHLRVGDGSPPAKSPREEERPRAERAYREERPERRPEPHDRRSRFENRREDRRGSVNVVREISSTPRGKARQSVRPSPVASPGGAQAATSPANAPEVKLPIKENPAVEKTFSDTEILASIKEPPKKVESKPAPKPSRRTPDNQTRLWMNVGEEMGIVPIDIVNAIAGETGLPGKVVGMVDIRERHLFADVASEHVKGIIAKLNRSEIKGHKLKVKVA